MLDMAYWATITLLYSYLLWRLLSWEWWRYFPVFCGFLAQNVIFTLILFCLHNGTWSYLYAYSVSRALDIILGLFSLIELSRCSINPVTYTLAFYFIAQFLILSVAAPTHWYHAEQLIKPMVIGFECVWIWTFTHLHRHIKSQSVKGECPDD